MFLEHQSQLQTSRQQSTAIIRAVMVVIYWFFKLATRGQWMRTVMLWLNHTHLLLLGNVHTMFQVVDSAEWKGERIPGTSEELHSYQTKAHQRPGGQSCACGYRLLTFFLLSTQYLPLINCLWTASSIWGKVVAWGSQKVWPWNNVTFIHIYSTCHYLSLVLGGVLDTHKEHAL